MARVPEAVALSPSLCPQTISNVLLQYADIVSKDFASYCSKEKEKVVTGGHPPCPFHTLALPTPPSFPQGPGFQALT